MKKFYGMDDAIFSWIFHPHHFYEYGLSIGIPASTMLSSAALSSEDIEQLDLKLSWRQYRKLLQLISHSERTPKDWLFQLGKHISPASHGLVSLAILNCTSIARVVDIITRYTVFVAPIFYINKRESTQHVHLTVHSSFTRDSTVDMLTLPAMMILFQTIRQVSPLNSDPNELKLHLTQSAPSDIAARSSFFKGCVTWQHSANELRIGKTLYHSATAARNTLAASNMQRILQAQLEMLPSHQGCLQELSALFSMGLYSQQACADALYTSTASLKRHLNAAHTSFSAELMRYRINEACWSLQYEREGINQLSDRLGFQDTSSFRRLFKQAMQVSPSEFRSRMQAQELER